MALAAVELFFTIPITSYGIYLNVSAAPLNPWISWANVHYGYSKVDQYPAILWRSDYNTVVAFGLSTWSAPFCALVFFGFFGFAEEARRNYAKVLAPLYRFAHALKDKLGLRRYVTTCHRLADSPFTFLLGHRRRWSRRIRPRRPCPHLPLPHLTIPMICVHLSTAMKRAITLFWVHLYLLQNL